MGYRVNFLDNTLVTAKYLNAVTDDLGGGALSFSDDMLYGVDDLNGIAETLITKGVSDGCGLSISGESVTIAGGVLFMPDGRKVVIDDGGVTLNFITGSVNYVWFYQDALTGFVAPRCTTEAPGGDYVLLGQVTADGAVSGRPERAVMKNPYLGLHGMESFTESFLWDGTTEEKLLWEYELQDIGYRMLMVHSAGNSRVTDGDVYMADDLCGFVKLDEGTAFNMTRKTDDQANGCTGEVKSYTNNNGEIYWGRVKGYNDKYYHHIYLRFELGADKLLRVYQRAVKGGYITAPSNTTKAAEITITVS